MNGPWHYATAERLLERAEHIEDGLPAQVRMLAQAQAHATLAQAAAIAGLVCVNPPNNAGSILGRSEDDEHAWADVL